MKTDFPSVYAERYDSPLRWRVRSRTRGHISYIVSLATWECQCEDWECRKGPLFRAAGDRKWACWHMEAALREFWRGEGLPRLCKVPVVRRLPPVWVAANWRALALGFIDEIKHLEHEGNY